METVNVTAVDLFIQDALLEIRGAPTAANLTEFIDQLFAGPDRDFLRSTSLPGETWGEVDGQCFLLLDEASKGDAKLEALVERAIGTSEAAVDQISLRDLRLRPATMLGIAGSPSPDDKGSRRRCRGLQGACRQRADCRRSRQGRHRSSDFQC